MKEAPDIINNLIESLNHKKQRTRLAYLSQLAQKIKKGEIRETVPGEFVNNHIHTTYSFSPFSPTAAIWQACQAGLATAGIIDHDTVSGTSEFIKAGKITGIATTIGFELRVDFGATSLAGRRINNPDQCTIAYCAVHGLPHGKIRAANGFLAPLRRERNKRNLLMVEKLSSIIKPLEMSLDYKVDVLPLSMAHEGGSVTERHILFALAKKLVTKYGKGGSLCNAVMQKLGIEINARQQQNLSDIQNPYYEYDLLGVLKSGLVERFYINAVTECPPVTEFVRFISSTGSIPAYAYLGDVRESVTGDKKSLSFEDGYLQELFEVINGLGFKAVTYMPSRNSTDQLLSVKKFCEKYALLEISGEDINSPRQSFICEHLRENAFRNLIDTTWAIIGHEREATKNPRMGFFSPETERRFPGLAERIEYFKHIGMKR
ncbi:MAG: PHP domain-containing protein [Spirochaetaceae bacterium]|nr:MAG: PHP domain-containing protein [Spirochaetaceae bacterium]